MWPKPSQKRTWSIRASPVLTWLKPKSTPWWRRTATPASSNPPRTWNSAERPRRAKDFSIEDLSWKQQAWCDHSSKGHKLTDAQQRLEGFRWNSYLSQRSFCTVSCGVISEDPHVSGSKLEAKGTLWLWEETDTDWAAGDDCLWKRHVYCTYGATVAWSIKCRDSFTQQNYHLERCLVFSVALMFIYSLFIKS